MSPGKCRRLQPAVPSISLPLTTPGPITIKVHTLQLPLVRWTEGLAGSLGNGQERICIRRMGSNLTGDPGIRKGLEGDRLGTGLRMDLEVKKVQLEIGAGPLAAGRNWL